MTQKEFDATWISLLPQLKKFALRVKKNREDAEDLIQDCYYKANKALSTYKEESSAFKTWVINIIKNKNIDDHRKKVTRSSVNCHFYIHDDFDENDLKDKKTFQVLNTEINFGVGSFIQEDIIKAISKLSDEERVPFQMMIDGYSYDQIAENLRRPIGTIKARIHTARIKLKELLTEYKIKQ